MSRLAARIVEEAEALWRESPDARTVAERNGWGWHYGKPGFKWCGHTAAVILRAVGLRADIAEKVMVSTARLADKGPAGSRWRDLNLVRPAIGVAELAAGDIVCVVTGANKPYGDHVVLAVSAPDANGNFLTVEGNARGELSSGRHGYGVVARTRHISAVRQVLRVKEEHLA